jgi:para-aminobenzoate synthetase/4-amino-4-deoxychorismate lyase
VTLQGNSATCGIGSGITSGALADAEWKEWRYKRAFVERVSKPFELLETLRLENGQLKDLSAHLERMNIAAGHFSYPWFETQVVDHLRRIVLTHPLGNWRIRLLVNFKGEVRSEVTTLSPLLQDVTLKLASRAIVEAHSEFVRFKTTRREHYEAFSPTQKSIFDTLLWNEDGEITECTRGNIALFLDSQWLTPPLHCGLLGGIGRTNALNVGRLIERVVSLDDLRRVKRYAFVNNLRGWRDANLILS